MGEQASRTKAAARAVGDPAVRAALLFIALAGGAALAMFLVQHAAGRPPIKGLDRPEVVVLSRALANDPSMTYSVEVHRGGEVVFDGAPEVLLPGRHVYLPPREEVDALFALIDGSRFRWLKPRYRMWYGGRSRTTLCLRQDETAKCVDAWGTDLFRVDGGPETFDEIHARVAAVARPDRWLKADEKTIEVFDYEKLDPRSIGGRRLMVRAAVELSPPAVQALIDAGFPADAEDEDRARGGSVTATEIAASYGRYDVLRILLVAGALKDKPAAVRQRTVTAAARACDPAQLQLLRDFGAEADPSATPPAAFDCAYAPPITNQVATAQMLLARGVSPNVRDDKGRTPLYANLEPEVIDLLLKNGADPNARDKAGATPLICATEEKAALALIKGGAAIDAPSATCVFGAPATIDDLAAASNWTQVQALLAQRRGPAA